MRVSICMNVNVENKMWMGLHCMSGYNGALLQSINNTDAPKFRRAATLRRAPSGATYASGCYGRGQHGTLQFRICRHWRLPSLSSALIRPLGARRNGLSTRGRAHELALLRLLKALLAYAKPAGLKRMRVASTKTQLDLKEFIRKLAASCAGQLDVTSNAIDRRTERAGTRSLSLPRPKQVLTYAMNLHGIRFLLTVSMISLFLSSPSCSHASEYLKYCLISSICRSLRLRPLGLYMCWCIQIKLSTRSSTHEHSDLSPRNCDSSPRVHFLSSAWSILFEFQAATCAAASVTDRSHSRPLSAVSLHFASESALLRLRFWIWSNFFRSV
jgi:hypothetical protein